MYKFIIYIFIGTLSNDILVLLKDKRSIWYKINLNKMIQFDLKFRLVVLLITYNSCRFIFIL